MRVLASFTGRKNGAIGIRYHIERVFEITSSSLPLANMIYHEYEHITGLTYKLIDEDMTIYKEAVILGIELDNHCSDLYLKACDDSERLIEKYKNTTTKMVTKFISQIDGSLWYDIPFAYDPYWEK